MTLFRNASWKSIYNLTWKKKQLWRTTTLCFITSKISQNTYWSLEVEWIIQEKSSRAIWWAIMQDTIATIWGIQNLTTESRLMFELPIARIREYDRDFQSLKLATEMRRELTDCRHRPLAAWKINSISRRYSKNVIHYILTLYLYLYKKKSLTTNSSPLYLDFGL